MTYYIVHAENIGKPPAQTQRAVLATWAQDHAADIPTQADLDSWCRQFDTFTVAMVDDTGKLVCSPTCR